ncbi:hypothetical protein EDC01DRAFT_628068 [Geopyxis carbonaria]|nr:hypothetical protein EDC01DRAFT_628068 [Geopyxis carbonaria]
MEFSSVYRGIESTDSTASNGSIPSPDGALIASLVASRLVIRVASTLQVQRVIPLDARFASNITFLKWSPLPLSNITSPNCSGFTLKRRSGIDNSEEEGRATPRILLGDEETIQVYDVKDEKWNATINQGNNNGSIKNVEFGRNEDEVLLFSEFQLKVTVWSLITMKYTEIANPKFYTRGFGYRPCTSHFAILTRASTRDIVSIHQNTTYRISSTFTLPTLDAQGLRWSPCGRWLAIWDSAVAGYKVLVYTADGHLYRTHEKPCEGLGVKTVEWSPSGDFLTVGSYDGKLCFLSNYTFSPVISMNHTKTVRLPGVTVWSESAAAQDRYYTQVQQPTMLPIIPFNPSDLQPKIGISSMAFSNPDGTLIATKNDNMPNTVWIWSLKLLRPYAVLVHLNPIKSMSWHPSIAEMLMIQCSSESNGETLSKQSSVVYLWSSAWSKPRAVQVPMDKVTGSIWAKWVWTNTPSHSHIPTIGPMNPQPVQSSLDQRGRSPEKDEDKRPMLLFGDREGFLVGRVTDDPIPEGLGPNSENLAKDDQLCHAWSPIEWSHYSATSDFPKKSMPVSSKMQDHYTDSIRSKNLISHNNSSRSSSLNSKEVDDTFEFLARKSSVSIQT